MSVGVGENIVSPRNDNSTKILTHLMLVMFHGTGFGFIIRIQMCKRLFLMLLILPLQMRLAKLFLIIHLAKALEEALVAALVAAAVLAAAVAALVKSWRRPLKCGGARG